MGLFKAVKNLFRGLSDQAEEAMKDPVRDGKFAIEDAQGEVQNFKTKIADLMAQTTGLRRQLEQAKAQSGKFDGFARQAALAKKPDDIKKALEQKAIHDKKIASLNVDIAKNELLIGQMRQQLDDAIDQISQAEGNLVSLSAREQAAKMRQEMTQAASDIASGTGGLGSLKDLEKAVQKSEDTAQAQEDLLGSSPAGVEKSLEQKYGAESAGLDAEVARYMQEAAGGAPAAKAAGKKK